MYSSVVLYSSIVHVQFCCTCPFVFAELLPVLVEKEKTTPPEEEKPEGDYMNI